MQAACEYVLRHTQSATGGFACWGGGSRPDAPAPRSLVIHCLNGNLLRALIGFGRLDDERVQRAVDWQARSITGEEFSGYYNLGTSGPGFRCGSNGHLPCAWGAIKALLGLARIPSERRAPHIERAIEQGAAFLLGENPATATYPAGGPSTGPAPPGSSWAFPTAMSPTSSRISRCCVSWAMPEDARLEAAVDWLLSRQEPSGRWKNTAAYHGKLWMDIDRQGQVSKWVTLRACSVLKAVYG